MHLLNRMGNEDIFMSGVHSDNKEIDKDTLLYLSSSFNQSAFT